ncbi:MAG: mannose-1-phosphate guanylyltransferase/mannose-6-phosphate isomerase [Gammaproteobacteria bacterium]
MSPKTTEVLMEMDSSSSIIPIVMCGGSGTRLWPLSRRQHPKQFLKLYGERSPFQEAVRRAGAIENARPPLVIGNEDHRFLILDELAEIGVSGLNILLEPVARNTAAALAMAAIHAARNNPKALLLAMPADHYVDDRTRFAASVKRGVSDAKAGAIVLFGVKPTGPNTGYGYIHKSTGHAKDGVHRVMEFKEKPDAATAVEYLSSGEYLWNSGVFLVRADVYLSALERHAPDIAAAAASAVQSAKWNGIALQLNREALMSCRSESIDYAVMEHTRTAKVVEVDYTWNDLGTWASLLHAGAGGAGKNVARGDVLLTDVEGSFVHSSGKLVTAVGLRNQVVISTDDAVFVAPIDRASEVKGLVAALESEGREEVELHPRVHRPWGWYERLARDTEMQVKLIQVNPGASLSLQMHHHRSEHWVVVRGEAEVTRDDEVFTLRMQESTDLPAKTRHRLRNNGTEPLQIIEVQRGSYLGEDDIVRFDDNYGRAANS